MFLECMLNFKGSSRLQDRKVSGGDDETRQKLRDDSSTLSSSAADGSPQDRESRASGIDASSGKAKAESEHQPPELIDPLAGMPAVDKWGIKGLRTLMNNYPDYHAMVVGMDPGSLGLDINSQE
jgi:CCR4-NOT transcription complex subunit 2